MKSDPIGTLANEAAANWRVRHETGLTVAEQAAFGAWLRADPKNSAAWSDVNATLATLERAQAAAGTEALMSGLAGRRRRRWQRRSALAIAGLGAAVMLTILLQPRIRMAPPQAVPVPAAVVVAPAVSDPLIIRNETRTLPDGSRVELAPGAIVTVDYTAALRRIHLLRGKGFFNVEKDPTRPFVVVSDAVETRAVGTRFAVQCGATTVVVLVTEGTVAIKSTTPANAMTTAAMDPVLVEAGKELTLPAHSLPSHPLQAVGLSANEIARQMDWRQPRLQLSDTPLRDAIASLNRINSMQIVLTDPELADLRLTGSYRAEDAPGFVRLLERNFAIQIHRRSDGTVELREK